MQLKSREKRFTTENFRFSIPDVFGAPEIHDLVDILKSISETEKSG